MSEIIIPVILCGGAGARLWPASRDHHPKQLLKLAGDYSLLQETARRALRITGVDPSRLVTVTLEKLQKEIREQLEELTPLATHHILTEPCARNTAAAIAFAASYVKEKFGAKAVIWVLPSDHHIGNEIALKSAFFKGLKEAKQNHLVTFGIRPTRPETGYGYIGIGDALGNSALRRVEKFIEKPDLLTAKDFVNSGFYLWNSGMFLFTAEHVLAEFERHAPHILKGITSSDGYTALSKEPFDRAIMEKSDRVAVIPCNPGWSDIGSWGSLWEIRDKDKDGNVIDGRVAFHDTKNCLIQAKERLVVCAGLENIVVIETGDVILVADRTNPEAMRVVVKSLKNAKAVERITPLRRTSANSR